MVASKRRRGAATGAVVFAVAALGTTACGSSSGSGAAGDGSPTTSSTGASGSTPSPKGGKPKDLCTVITATDAARVFGETAQPTPSPSAEPLVSGLCLYHHDGDDFTVRHLLQIRTYPGPQFYGGRLFPHRRSLAGLGSQAFEDVNIAAHKVEVQFVKNGKTGTIDSTTGGAVDVQSQTDTLVALAKKLAASM